MKRIIVIAEQSFGRVVPFTHELIAAACRLRQLTGFSVTLIMTGPELYDAGIQLSEKYGMDILIISPVSRRISGEMTLKTLPVEIFDGLNPAYVCMAHNTRGLDAAPGLALKMNAACITGVEKISQTDGSICFTRSLFNDRITARVRSCAKTNVLTISPGMFKPVRIFSRDENNTCQISTLDLSPSEDVYHLMEMERNADDTSALDNADVIVSAGNGIREKENLDLVFQLAELFSKSAVTGSRPICDKKWLKYCQQVGITGATVTPKLYIACGISGSSQHISGMRDSKFIVSINTDPHAAIFNISDICIIEDLITFIPQFISAFREFRVAEK